jgi:hypothetical protein
MKRLVMISFMCCLLVQSGFSKEEKKSGGAFVIMPHFLNLNLSPVEDLMEKEPGLRNYTYNFSNNLLMVHGIGAYWGSKNGARAGFGLWGGYKEYQSDPYTGTLLDSSGLPLRDSLNNIIQKDSIVELNVIPAYIGFLIDHSYSLGPVNLYGGGILGSGVIVLVKNTQAKEEQSAFYSSSSGQSHQEGLENDSLDENSDLGAAVSILWVLDLHLGATYSVAKWFHFGAEASALLFHSTEGFGPLSESFTTLNPGFRFRLIFGSLG